MMTAGASQARTKGQKCENLNISIHHHSSGSYVYVCTTARHSFEFGSRGVRGNVLDNRLWS